MKQQFGDIYLKKKKHYKTLIGDKYYCFDIIRDLLQC